MVKAKVLNNGRCQTIELPAEFHVDVDEVILEKTPQGFLVIPRDPWELFHEGAEKLSDDFMAERIQPPQQHRNWDP